MVYSEKQQQIISQRGRFESQVKDSTKDDISHQKRTCLLKKAAEFQTAIANAKNLTEKKKKSTSVTMDLLILGKLFEEILTF